MSSLNTFFTSPGSFLKGLTNKSKNDPTAPTYIVGFSTWKQYLRKYFPERTLLFLDKNISKHEFEIVWKKKILSQANAEIFIWGFKAPEFIFDFAQKYQKKIVYVEDGFIRSVSLGAQKTPPLSLTMDSRTPYFDARKPSDLEVLLNEYNFEANPELIERATSALALMLGKGISKYNNASNVDIGTLYEKKTKRRVLVIGQVEDDASILLGCTTKMTNNDLVRLAAKENPGAQIIYKPHPDVLAGNRQLQSSPNDVKNICLVIESNISLPQSFHEVDHVYTLTSLAGFEALLRGIKVTTIGCPFYSGWGLTDDRQPNNRRTRKITKIELFAGAYILYPQYFSSNGGEKTTIESVIGEISDEMSSLQKNIEAEVVALKPQATKPTTMPAPNKPAAKSSSETAAKPTAKPAPKSGTKPEAKPTPKTASKPEAKATPKAASKPEAKATPKAAPKPEAKATPKVAPSPVAKPPVAPIVKPDYNEIPDWFNPKPGLELKSALSEAKPLYIYIPWIAGHGDSLIEKISSPNHYNLAPFDFIKNLDRNGTRQDALRFARANPGLYRRMLINRLVPLRGKISGVIFTFDWSPVMRLISAVCEELQIPRILIPHESVFVDRNKYYWDETSRASIPVADIILGWGEMQKQIFSERGYPAERFEAVGAPKFDTYANYEPQLTRSQFCRLFGLREDKKIVLFASQPLDSQLDKKAAQLSQRKAINDLFEVLPSLASQLLVRLPPNKEDILGPSLRIRLKESADCAVDDGQCYLVAPEEALFHADLVTSINSTMLFEALLMNRPALSLKYVDFNQIWANAGIPAVQNKIELNRDLPPLLSGDWKPSTEGMQWAAEMFGIGTFDGAAAQRIKHKLADLSSGAKPLVLRKSALERFLAKESVDVIAIPSSLNTFQTTQLYVLPMLNARTCISTSGPAFDKKEAASVDIFFQWGITESNNKKRQRELATELGRPVLYIEDGFIRSLDIGLSQEPGLSIIIDDTTAYYDATRVSRLQRLLQDGPDLSQEQLVRSRAAIDKIVRHRVSKYNHAPDVKLTIGTPGRKKVMLIDQRYGDQSVASGLGSDAAFDKMLRDVIRDRSDCDILIKQHPDAIKGGKSSYFSNEKLAFTEYMDNVHPILFDVNPFALFDIVDEVYVMTSGMGFEALMAGKTVHCYGMPFYAGWGSTHDQQKRDSRTRSRSVEELFHFAYIESSRYFNPVKGHTVEVEDIVDHIVGLRGW